MRKILLGVFALIFVFALSACGSDETTTDKKTNDDKEASKVEKKDSIKKGKAGTLTKIGQRIIDPNIGTVQLDKYKKLNQSFDQGGLKVSLDDIKILTVTNMTSDFKDQIENNTDLKIGDNLTYAQVTYDVENDAKQTLTWRGFETAVIDGEQTDLDSNALVNSIEGQGDIQQSAKLSNNYIGIKVNKNVKEIRLVPSDVLGDENTMDVFHGNPVTINLQ